MFANSMFALPYRWVTQIRFVSVTNPDSGKDPQFRFLCVVKGGTEVTHESIASQAPSAQSNPHAKVAHLGGGCPEPLHWTPDANISAIRRASDGCRKSHLQVHLSRAILKLRLFCELLFLNQEADGFCKT